MARPWRTPLAGLFGFCLLSVQRAADTPHSADQDQVIEYLPEPPSTTEGSGDNATEYPLQDDRSVERPDESFFQRLPLEGRPFGPLDGFSPRQGPPLSTCHKRASCEPLRYSRCFGTRLGYPATSLNLTGGLLSQEQAQESLRQWEALRHIPKCWSVVQPFLCAVFMPKCENGSVELPSLEMCQKARSQCRFAEALMGWPTFLECDPSRFPSKCKSSLLDLEYNTTTSCLSPLVATKNKLAFYPTVEGCGQPCPGLLYTDRELKEVHRFTHVFGALSFALTLLTVLTYIIDWRSFSKYAANRCIFFINFCLCLSILGFLVQFIDESRETVVCQRDGTPRGPGSEESGTPCTAVFVLIYYPAMAACCWFVMLTFAWNSTFKTFGQSRDIQERLGSLTSYFHLISWSVPLVLTTAALATTDVVDSSYVYGVCFVGYKSWEYRVGFVLVPTTVAILIGSFFLVRSVVFLVRQTPDRSDKRLVISISIARLCACGLLLVAVLITSYVCHVREYANRTEQLQDVHRYLMCRANATVPRYDYGYASTPACAVTHRPDLLVLKCHLFCLFAVGVLFSSWVWRRSTLRSWARFYRRVIGKPEERPVRRIRKHQVIAQAWSKRYDLAQNGRISLSFHTTRSDPVGMYLGLNSAVSESPSSSFFAAIPNLLERRGALIGSTSSALGLGRNSDGSLYSLYSRASRASRTSRHSRYSRRLSLDSDVSRRHSLDSTRSLYRSELDRVAALLGGRRRGRRRALADLRRTGRPAAGRSDSTLSRSRRSSSVSRASSSISSQLAHALGSITLARDPRSSRVRSGRTTEHRRKRRGTGALPQQLGGVVLVDTESSVGGSIQGRDNASYVDSDGEMAGSRHRSHEQDGRRSAASSKRAASRQSRGQSSNVSSGSSILNLRQRLLGDVVDFARSRRHKSNPTADTNDVTDDRAGLAAAAIELTKLPPAGDLENQAAISVAVQTTPEPTRRPAVIPDPLLPGAQEARNSLTLYNKLHGELTPERLNNGRASPYTKNQQQRLSLPLDQEPEEKLVNTSFRSSSSRSSHQSPAAVELDDSVRPELV